MGQMKAKESANDNDYAVARELHDSAIKLLGAVTQLNDAYNYDDPYVNLPKS